MNDNISIAEDSTAFFEVDLKDPDGLPAIPSAAFLTVYCMTNGVETMAEAPVTPLAAALAIKIPSTANEIIKRTNVFEIRRAVLRCVYGVGDEFKTSRDYRVRKVDL